MFLIRFIILFFVSYLIYYESICYSMEGGWSKFRDITIQNNLFYCLKKCTSVREIISKDPIKSSRNIAMIYTN